MFVPKIFDLNKKVALISGASRGIGAAIAKILTDFGAKVILTSRKEENLNEIKSIIKKKWRECDIFCLS